MPKLTRAMKIGVASAHALLPWFFALRLQASPEHGPWPPPMDWLLGAFWLVSIGIFTSELLMLQKYPDEPGAMAVVLVMPPALIVLNAVLLGADAVELLLQAATFYLALYVVVMLWLAYRRFVVERTVRGWAWGPTAVALVLLFVPSVTALFVFVRTLVEGGVLDSRVSTAVFALSVGIAARSEVRIAYRAYPATSPAGRLVNRP